MSIPGEVFLPLAFINLASNPSQYVTCGTAGSQGGGGARTDTIALTGSFRQYANNVTRLVQGTGSSEIISVVLRALTPAQVQLITSWIGQTILFRDTYGRCVYGSYLTTAATDIPLSGAANSTLLTDIVLDIQTVTYVAGLS